MIFAVLYHAPADVLQTAMYGLVVATAAISGAIVQRQQLAAWHRAHPRIAATVVALVLAFVLAVSSEAMIIVPACLEDVIRDRCNGDQRCINWELWWCWLLGILY